MPHVVLVAIEDALASSITAPMEMLRAASQYVRTRGSQADALELSVASEQGGDVIMSGGLSVNNTTPIDQVRQCDLLVLPSLWRAPARTVLQHPNIRAAAKRLGYGDCTLCATGTGSYFLAQEGLLNNRSATTHWSFFDDFAKRFPAVELRRHHLITQSGRFYCAGSVNSVADLMVHFINGFFGQQAAQQVEGQFSPEIRRRFETHSFVQGQVGAHPDEAIWQAQDWLAGHIAEPVNLAQMAERAGLSVRSFTRRFKRALGVSPIQYLVGIRMRNACDLLRSTDLSIGEIAPRCGYPDVSHFSRIFAQHCGAAPSLWRRRTRGKLFKAEVEPSVKR